jgi:hypothetical protein
MTKKKNDNDLLGFEEFIESIDNGPSFVDRISLRKDSAPEFITFITNDLTRLKKIITLQGQRLPLYKKFPQSEQVVKDEQAMVNQLKSELIDLLKKEKSPMYKSFAEIYSAFSKK